MAEAYLGEIRMVGFNYAPSGWAMCNGQTLSIQQNTALFALLGTIYGGNGTTTFQLPDLRSRVPLGMGQGVGLSVYNQGQAGGAENVTLLTPQIPAHAHGFALQANTNNANQPNPAGAIFAQTNDGEGDAYPSYTKLASNTTMAPQNTAVAGSGQPHTNIQPYLALNFIIALQGIFPPRS